MDDEAGSGWRDRLAAEIEVTPWVERLFFRGPDWVNIKHLRVEIGPMHPGAAVVLTKTVNLDPVAGAPAGTLLLDSVACDGIKGEAVFVLRDRPWNEFPTPEGGWQRMVDAAGSPLYRETDFSGIP